MIPRLALAESGAAMLICSLLLPTAPAGADDASHIPADVNTSFSSSEVEAVLTEGDAPALTGDEQSAVDSYIASEAANGNVVEPQDVNVGTLTDGGLDVVVTTPDDAVVENVSFVTDDSGDAMAVGFEATDSEDAPASQAGPGMGYWPHWEEAFHSTIRLRIEINYFYVGDVRVQTYKRRYHADGSSEIDSWQIARDAVANPATNYSPEPRVKKIWASQNLTDAAFGHAREWLANRTAPEEDFTDCTSSGVNLVYGPFEYSPSDCDDYYAWTGRIAHHRVAYDQGSSAGTGSHELAYTTGWTMDDGATTPMTYYQFVTYQLDRFSDFTPQYKCTNDELAADGTTQTGTCNFTN